MLTVYLLRHGETAYNADGNRYCGLTDLDLTDRGIEQAKQIAVLLQGASIDSVYASPLRRAYRTAALATGGQFEVKTDQRLMELDFGSWEGKTRQEFVAENPALWEAWDASPEKARAGGTGNTALEIVKRVDTFFSDMLIKHANANIMVVAHNTVNRLYLAYKLGMPLRNYRQIVQENSAVSRFELDEQETLSLHQLNAH